MNIKRRKILLTTFFIFCFGFVPFVNMNDHFAVEEIIVDSQAYTQSDPIIIQYDGPFITYGFPGSGTEEDPYIIENYNITTSENTGILIMYTTKHFVVRNCLINALSIGIYLDITASNTGIIENNTIIDNSIGISLYYSAPCTILNNTFSNNYYGITTDHSEASLIANNTFIENNYYGIKSSSLSSSTIVNNTFIRDGILINEDTAEYYDDYTLIDNTLNGKPIGYVTNLQDGVFDNDIYGELILINCTRAVVKNHQFSNATIGCYVKFSTNVTITSNTYIDMIRDGILIEESDRTLVSNNTFSENINHCLRLSSCNFSRIQDNVFNNNDLQTIDLSFCHFGDVINNTVSGNLIGVDLYFSYSTNVLNNTFSGNNLPINLFYAKYIVVDSNTCSGSGYRSMLFQETDNCTIRYNTFYQKSYGLYIQDNSDYNYIYNNSFIDNYQYSVYIVSGEENCIYFNTFTYNYYRTNPLAYDAGTNNLWYNTSFNIGNLWSDWTGDSTYQLDGTANSYDLYPIDFISPVFLSPPDDVSYEYGSTGNSIVWSPIDWSPRNYVIYRNAIYLEGDEWNGSDIVINVDGLAVDTYTYNCTVFDEFSNFASDIVIVTVTPDNPPTINHPDDIIYEFGVEGNNITWIPFDDGDMTYIVYLEGVVYDSGFCSSSNPIEIPVDNLAIGTYNFTIVVEDSMGSTVIDTVFVTVLAAVEEYLTGFSLHVIPSVMLLFAILITYRRRKKIRD